MLTISRKGDYGLLMLTALARGPKDKFVSLRKLARKNKLPYKFLSQIATKLSDAGLIESREGARGGYRLSQSPQEISVGEALEVLEGPVAPVVCLKEEECVSEPYCLHKAMMRQVANLVSEAMRQRTLADLVSRRPKQAGL